VLIVNWSRKVLCHLLILIEEQSVVSQYYMFCSLSNLLFVCVRVSVFASSFFPFMPPSVLFHSCLPQQTTMAVKINSSDETAILFYFLATVTQRVNVRLSSAFASSFQKYVATIKSIAVNEIHLNVTNTRSHRENIT
jgi:hypothetical protein